MQLRWEASLSNVYWSMQISGNKLGRREIARVFSSQKHILNKLTEPEREAFYIKAALNYINMNWYVTGRHADPASIYTLYRLSSLPILGKTSRARFSSTEPKLKTSLEYIQSGGDHPVIQSGLALIQIRMLSPFEFYNGRVARLLGILILYKYGYDFRGMIVPDEQWFRDRDNYRKAAQSALSTQNLTLWLEYYVQSISKHLERVLRRVRNPTN